MHTIEAALLAIRSGGLVLCVDNFDRENEGDFIGSSQHATAEAVSLVVRHTSGIVCAPMSRETSARLELPLMCPNNADPFRTAFTVTVDAKHGTTTGVSAKDRVVTLRALAHPGTLPADLTRPGHIFPLIGREGGVLVRDGHTEASLDLLRLAGAGPVAYLAEVVSDEGPSGVVGDMAGLPELHRLAERLSLPLISIADLQRYRYRREPLVGVEEGEGGGDPKAFSLTFSSAHHPGCGYRVGVFDEQGFEEGGRVYTAFTFQQTHASGGHTQPPPTVGHLQGAMEGIRAAAAASASSPARLILVHCTGDPRYNVQGGGAAKALEAAHTAGSLAVTSPPSAYSSLFPKPQGFAAAAAAAAAASTTTTTTLSDRTCAEIAQVVSATVRGLSAGAASSGGGVQFGSLVQPGYQGCTWRKEGGEEGCASLEGSEESILQANAPHWPLVFMAPVQGQPLPHIWEFGCRVQGVVEGGVVIALPA